jgi:Indole-3-glycerol phosphate synthase
MFREHKDEVAASGAATIRLPVMTSARRFSQAISEGDGISVIADVADAEAARTAAADGAEGLSVAGSVAGLPEATPLPVLWRGRGSPAAAHAAGADACVLAAAPLQDDGDHLERLHSEASELGLDCVVQVRDEEELEVVLDRLDPDILLLSGDRPDGDEGPLDAVLRLLGDVPAGKLAVADVAVSDRAEIAELERAGVDAVIVAAASVAVLVGAAPPEV